MDGRVTMSNSKEELIDYAKELGIEVDDSMKKQEIYDTIEAFTADEEATVEPEDGSEKENKQEGDDEPQPHEGGKAQPEKSESDFTERKAKALQFNSGHKKYAYVGATVRNTSLRENAVFSGTLEEVLDYLAPELEEYPEAVEMIVPVSELANFNRKKKMRGNSAYNKFKATESMAAKKRKEQAKK